MITKDIHKAVAALKKDELIALPTETVYGLAGNAFSETAVRKIFQLKQRPLYNPLIVHIPNAERLSTIAQEIPPMAKQLAETFWPGPLTLLLPKKAIVPDLITAGKPTVAVRVPRHPMALEILAQLPFPLAAPSANPFGSISPTSAKHVFDYFGDKLSIVLDGGHCENGIESTIIGFKDGQPVLYRHGSIAIEAIEEITGKLTWINHHNIAPAAPGMLARHYAPDTTTYLTNDVKKMVEAYRGKSIGLLLFHHREPEQENLIQEVLSSTGDLTEAAQNLYAALHRLDAQKLDLIIAEAFPNEGLGMTINDRLQRAIKR